MATKQLFELKLQIHHKHTLRCLMCILPSLQRENANLLLIHVLVHSVKMFSVGIGENGILMRERKRQRIISFSSLLLMKSVKQETNSSTRCVPTRSDFEPRLIPASQSDFLYLCGNFIRQPRENRSQSKKYVFQYENHSRNRKGNPVHLQRLLL